MSSTQAAIQGSLPLSRPRNPKQILTGLAPAKPTPLLNTYWNFAVERQEVFFRRVRGETPPWTDDFVLANHRFTNAYRASDRVSQFLIKNVIYEGDQSTNEVFFRVLLFKFFNKIDTWNLLVSRFDNVCWSEFEFEEYDAVLTEAIESGTRIYSAAYIMPSGGRNSSHRYKHSMHLRLLERMVNENLADRISESTSMGHAFDLLREYPTIGDFLAYQFVTDLNYSSLIDFSELEFTVAGPGARDGISKCFSHTGGLTEAEIIRLLAERQDDFFGQLELDFKDLWGRPLQLIDIQNLFCEVSKYTRVTHPDVQGISGRTRIKQKYSPGCRVSVPWYPPSWGLNEKIALEECNE